MCFLGGEGSDSFPTSNPHPSLSKVGRFEGGGGESFKPLNAEGIVQEVKKKTNSRTLENTSQPATHPKPKTLIINPDIWEGNAKGMRGWAERKLGLLDVGPSALEQPEHWDPKTTCLHL